VLATARYRKLLIKVLEWIETPRRGTEATEKSVGSFVSGLMRRRIRNAMATLADQTSLPWPDEFPRKLKKVEIPQSTQQKRIKTDFLTLRYHQALTSRSIAASTGERIGQH
jgi:hypothetical protein